LLKFFYVGRIGHIKGIYWLLQAFTQLDNTKCELHIVGDVSGKEAKAIIRGYRKVANIVFYGKVLPEEVSSLIRGWDVLVHPAIYLEVFGLNISEALLAGKPVIATRCGGAEMQVEDNVNGLLIAPNEVEALKEAMQRMLEHPEEVQRMAVKAPDKVVSLTEHVHQLLDCYRSLDSRIGVVSL
jgi:glycosyltransferase involved in cell wall biosynthesis